jgi:uncharacterized membrane protein (DUF4010 family)
VLEIFSRLAIVLGLGLLVGLQRQRTDARLAGFRTFPLVTLLGALAALLAGSFGGWVVAAGIVALAVVIVGGNLPLLHGGGDRPGVTTEVAMLVMFGLGAYTMVGSTGVAIVTCGAVVVLLHLKPQMHTLALKIGDRDFAAMMQFALISLVILPVLPDRAYGPLDVLNPFKIWLMVVLIVGLSLGGYVVYKLLDARAGIWASGILGGVISSTATTVSVARGSRAAAGRAAPAAFVVVLASAVVFVRLGILISATAPEFLRASAVPLAAMGGVLLLFAVLALRGHGREPAAVPVQTNPSELGPALLFGALYAAVLLAAAAANRHFGAGGLVVTAVISGLTDMDAITLSIAQMVNAGTVDPRAGWRLVLLAAVANLGFKAGAVALLGGPALFRRVGLCFGGAALAALLLHLFLS